MKSKLFIFTILFFSQKLMAQFTVAQPELFSLANNSNTPCPVSDIGKIFYSTNANAFAYCADAFTAKHAGSYWEGGSDIYYMGKITINKSSGSYELDLLGTAKFNLLSVNGKVGINTTAPTEKLELVNRDIIIKSTADVKSWVLANPTDRFEFQEQGFGGRIIIKSGGNVGVGNVPNTDKLRVQGDVSYAGSLSVEGKGILSNSNTNQLVMYTGTSMTSSNDNFLISSNTCTTIGFTFPSSTFTTTPAVFLGQNLSLTPVGHNLIKSVINVTTNGGSVQICNTTGAAVTFSNQSFSLMAIGQQ
jgi:hypothetical protein